MAKLEQLERLIGRVNNSEEGDGVYIGGGVLLLIVIILLLILLF